MTIRIDTEADLAAALVRLVVADPRLAPLLDRGGTPPLRRRPGGFAGLAAIVVSQQLSTASAAAIWGRVAAAFDPLEHTIVAQARPERLKRLGLSDGKIRTLKAIARAIRDGSLDLPSLAACSAEEAHAALVAVHGVGPWTADLYLLTCLGHADAWPAGDLALQEAVRHGFDLPARPSARDMGLIAEPWRPLRGVAARLLWNYYRAIKGRDPAPVPATPPPATPSRRP